MNTKKFKFKNANGNNVKGGKNNTRTILTAAGVIALGAATGSAGYAAGYAHATINDDEKPDTEPEKNAEENLENEEAQQIDTANPQQTEQLAQSQNGDNLTEPQPTDTGHDQQTNNTQTQQPINNGGQESATGTPDGTDPNLIAQQIIEENNIDPYDLDSPTIISVDELATLYRADGSEMLVAAFHTPDGTQYMLADTDGDGYFTDVFDMSGNYVGEAEGNLMASDLETMVDETGGYLAQNIEEPQGEDPTNDIITTSCSMNEDIAENSITVPVEVSDEELLAQLLEDEGEGGTRLIDDNWDYEDDNEEDGEEEDDDDSLAE